jgi:DNA-binding MarR family transcriptional regulator
MVRVIQIDVSENDVDVLAAIKATADRDGISWVAQSEIATMARCHRATVIRAIKRLRGAGYIELKGDRTNRAYKVIPQKQIDGTYDKTA